MITEKPKKCLHCGNTSFYLDDDEYKCIICSRVHRNGPVTAEYEEERGTRKADYTVETAQQRADRRYRETELYKQTRKKHQKKYRESQKGIAAKQKHDEKMKMLNRILKRLQEKGFI